MKRLIVFIVLLSLFSFPVYGVNSDLNKALEEKSKQIGDLLEIDDLTLTDITNASFADVIKLIFNLTKEQIVKPLKSFVICFCTAILVFISKGVTDLNSKKKYSLICCVAYSSSFMMFSGIIESAEQSIIKTVYLILGEIPVFASFLTVGGSSAKALTFSVTVFSLCQILSVGIEKLFLPLVIGVVCTSLASEFNSTLKLKKISSIIKKVTVTVLGFVSLIFTAVLGLKTTLNASVDSVGYKGLKFIIGSSVPVVGSSISDALSAIVGSVKLINSTYAVLLIIIVITVNLAVFSALVLWKLSFNVSASFFSVFDLESDFFDAMSDVCDLIISLVVFTVFIFTVSLAITISVK